MAADYSRIHRLLKILTLIQAESGWDAPRLAADCGVSVRSIYRDLEMLEAAGIPCFFDARTRSYQINRSFFMKPLELTLEEALALVALGEHLGGREQIPFTKAAAKAVAKVRSQLPEAIRREVEGLEEHVAIKLGQTVPAEGIADVYEKVRAAMAAGRVLRCEYEGGGAKGQGPREEKSEERGARSEEREEARAAEGGPSGSRSSLFAPRSSPAAESFLFQPYTLFFNERAWYVVGHHGGRNAVRSLKLNRFAALELTDETYTVPRSFSLEKHLGNAWRMIRGKETFDVELHFDAQFAESVAEVRWHATQAIEELDDGSILFRCKVDGLDEIVWWVLSMGPHCTVRQPAALAQRVRDLAAAVGRLYEGAPRAAAGEEKSEERGAKSEGGE